MRYIFIALFTICFITPNVASAKSLKIVASLPAIYSLVRQIIKGTSHSVELIKGAYDEDGKEYRVSRFAKSADLLILYDRKVDSFANHFKSEMHDAEVLNLNKKADIWKFSKEDFELAFQTQEFDLSLNYSWQNPIEVAKLIDAIEGKLSSLDPKHSEKFKENSNALIENVNDIGERIRDKLESYGVKDVLVIGYDMKYFLQFFEINSHYLAYVNTRKINRILDSYKDIKCIASTKRLTVKQRRYIKNNIGISMVYINPNFINKEGEPILGFDLDMYFLYNLRFISDSLVKCLTKS